MQQFRDKEFRDTYVAAHTRRFLARQMRKFRGELSQTEFAEYLGKQQTIVSRLENPNYSGWTLGTLLEIASKLNVGVVVRFVDFPSFLKSTDDFSESAIHPAPYDEVQLDDFAAAKEQEEISRLIQSDTGKHLQQTGPRQQLATPRLEEEDESAASYQSEKLKGLAWKSYRDDHAHSLGM